jgi:hypothetical protein
MYHSLSFASRKNHARDELPIENLPWGSGKGRCLWRRGKTCPAQAVHALSNETGTLIREDEKPLPARRHGEMSHIESDDMECQARRASTQLLQREPRAICPPFQLTHEFVAKLLQRVNAMTLYQEIPHFLTGKRPHPDQQMA